VVVVVLMVVVAAPRPCSLTNDFAVSNQKVKVQLGCIIVHFKA